MGEMTIRLNETTRELLEARARDIGVEPGILATMLVAKGVGSGAGAARSSVARAIQATQPTVSRFDSAALIRADRDSR